MNAIQQIIKKEEQRQNETLMMIPSENFASKEVRKAVGSVLMNKYSEGYAGKRYYQGNEFIDEIETIAVEKAKELFGVLHANVQPYSGSPANAAVMLALLETGDKVLGMGLNFGGHLTHGHPIVTFSGKYFESIQYSTDKTGTINYEEVRKLALEHKPKLIISGTTAYPRQINFEKFAEIADEIGAYHLADISHIAGLILGDVHPSPAPHAHIIMTTTHKTLRGPRGAILMVTEKGLEKDPDLAKKIDKAVFPGLQGGPHNNTTAGIAIALEEASKPEFKDYAKQIVENAKTLAEELTKYDFNLVSGGTENHLLLIDLSNKQIDGWCAAWALEFAGIIVNRNTIPYDNRSAFYPSGIRLGTPALTTLGMKEPEMIKVAKWINEVIEIAKIHYKDDMKKEDREGFIETIKNDKNLKNIAEQVKILLLDFRSF